MKQVWVNAATCVLTASTTLGAALPTLVTAMPDPKSISELPSTSTRTPPPARSMNTGNAVLTPPDTVSLRRANSSRERGPGSSVTIRRSCGRSAGAVPDTVVGLVVVGSVAVMVAPVLGRGSLARSDRGSVVRVGDVRFVVLHPSRIVAPG
jgi:hypothetical protein